MRRCQCVTKPVFVEGAKSYYYCPSCKVNEKGAYYSHSTFLAKQVARSAWKTLQSELEFQWMLDKMIKLPYAVSKFMENMK